MKEKFKMKNKQVVQTGMVIGGEKKGEHKTISKFASDNKESGIIHSQWIMKENNEGLGPLHKSLWVYQSLLLPASGLQTPEICLRKTL